MKHQLMCVFSVFLWVTASVAAKKTTEKGALPPAPAIDKNSDMPPAPPGTGITENGDTVTLALTAEKGQFDQQEFKVPAGKRIEVLVTNKGPEAEEFESKDLKREKLIPVGQTVKVTLGVLQAGKTYKFFGDYHQKTAFGKIIVK